MADQSSIGNHLAELYNSIHVHNQHVENAKAKVQEAEKALAKVKSDFADYLKQQGIDKLLAPTQTEVAPTQKTEATKERKARTSSADKQAEVERNKAIYTSTYPNGIDEKTGLPKRFKGRGPKNDEIDAQMKDDERDYEANNSGEPQVTTISKGEGDEAAAAEAIQATAPKAASKKKAAAVAA